MLSIRFSRLENGSGHPKLIRPLAAATKKDACRHLFEMKRSLALPGLVQDGRRLIQIGRIITIVMIGKLLRRSIKPSIALFCALVTVLALEFGSYLFGTFEGPQNPLRTGYIQFVGQHDPLLFWSLRPNAVGPNGIARINSLGLRGPEIGPKSRDEYRILCLGESTTFAARMPYEQCYVDVLEQLLNSEGRGKKVRVINAGVPAYTSFQGYQYLKHRGVNLEVDAVVIYFGYNDFLPVTFLAERAGGDVGQSRGLTDWELFRLRQTWFERVKQFLTNHSNSYRALVYGWAQELVDDNLIRTDSSQPRVPENDRQELLHWFLDFCQRRQIEFVVVIPWYSEFATHIPLLREFVKANDVHVVDLPLVLPQRLEHPQNHYFSDAVHPTPDGHRLIAEAIHEVLPDRGSGRPSQTEPNSQQQ